MGTYENARQDLLMVEQAELLAQSNDIGSEERHLIESLRGYNVGNRPSRDDLGRDITREPLSKSTSFYCLPDAIRKQLADMLKVHFAPRGCRSDAAKVGA